MQDAVVGGPGLTERRHLVTPVPGPRSLELHARKNAAVSDGIGVTLPVYVAAAGGGVIVDPPLVIGEELLDDALDVLEGAVSAVSGT
jgi:4-aminobutyrate aminotransferase/(S)-3-amino-2-methylpropionate transaminase